MLKKKVCFIIFSMVIVALIPATSFGLPSSADGDLSDWGVTRSGGEWVCDDGINYTVQNSARVRGGSGNVSQLFDAEGMGSFYSSEDGTLYVAVVTGTPPQGALYNGSTYAPGDLAIDFNGDGIADFGIETTGNGKFAQGTIVSTSSGDWSTSGANSTPTSLVGGTVVGTAQVQYGNNGGAYGKHYAIEMAIPVDSLSSMWGQPYDLTWTMESGKDVISLSNDGNGNDASPVPEPATLLLLGAGLLGVASVRKRA